VPRGPRHRNFFAKIAPEVVSLVKAPNPTALLAPRLTAQLLSGPRAASAEAVVERLLAVQAQDGRGARLAVRSRSSGLHASDVDDALNAARLLITWVNRGTLHLVRADDYWWLHPLTTPQLEVANRRRLAQEGVSPKQAARGVEVVTEAVLTHGPQTRGELRQRLEAARVPTAGQALIHVLVAATIRGAVVRGPMRGAQHAFVAVSDWLGDAPTPLARPDALAMLARRYLAGHGPADARDLAKWAGLPLGDARIAVAGIRDETVDRPDGLVDLADRAPAAPLPKPRLLGPFDPLLHGWVSREAVVGPHQPIVTSNGLFRASALVRGRVVGVWTLNGTQLTVKLLEPVTPAAVAALRTDASDVLRFLGLPEQSEIGFES
jgi:Winged helix DNA-binding domain